MARMVARRPDHAPWRAAIPTASSLDEIMRFVLGPLLEEHLRRAMIISRGDPSVFVSRPISLTLLVLAVGALVITALPAIRQKREVVFREEDEV